ncbi:MAG: stage II sporulation protein M [Clostridia bacterium]|nr:stage II sporulation protein M [Clostridia bacterium]
MKRTTTRRKREIKSFCAENRRLFPFAGLFLAGAVLGVLVYLTLTPASDSLDALLRVPAVTDDFFPALGTRLFSAVLLLGGLYLLGLWACGAPFILLVPLLYGLGLGLTEAHYYTMGQAGVIAVAAVILPYGLLTAAVLVAAAAESLRLSTVLSRQLLPGSDRGEGLWAGFRLYTLRYLLFLAVAAVIGLADVLLRRVAGGLLP